MKGVIHTRTYSTISKLSQFVIVFAAAVAAAFCCYCEWPSNALGEKHVRKRRRHRRTCETRVYTSRMRACLFEYSRTCRCISSFPCEVHEKNETSKFNNLFASNSIDHISRVRIEIEIQ